MISKVTVRLDLSPPMRAKGIHDTFHVSLLKPYEADLFKDTQKKPGLSVSQTDTKSTKRIKSSTIGNRTENFSS